MLQGKDFAVTLDYSALISKASEAGCAAAAQLLGEAIEHSIEKGPVKRPEPSKAAPAQPAAAAPAAPAAAAAAAAGPAAAAAPSSSSAASSSASSGGQPLQVTRRLRPRPRPLFGQCGPQQHLQAPCARPRPRPAPPHPTHHRAAPVPSPLAPLALLCPPQVLPGTKLPERKLHSDEIELIGSVTDLVFPPQHSVQSWLRGTLVKFMVRDALNGKQDVNDFGRQLPLATNLMSNAGGRAGGPWRAGGAGGAWLRGGACGQRARLPAPGPRPALPRPRPSAQPAPCTAAAPTSRPPRRTAALLPPPAPGMHLGNSWKRVYNPWMGKVAVGSRPFASVEEVRALVKDDPRFVVWHSPIGNTKTLLLSVDWHRLCEDGMKVWLMLERQQGAR